MFLDHDPSEFEQRSLSNVTGVVQREFGVQIQSITRSRRTWLATDELSPAASGLELISAPAVYLVADMPARQRPRR